jgi:membrane associated rhomboid family serine protease
MVIPLRSNAPHYDTPYVTLCLVMANCLVFALQALTLGGPQVVIDIWGLQPARIWEGGLIPGTDLPAWVTLLTSNYLHFDLFHLLGNMLVLWLMGDALEWLCGRLRFFLLYTLCGLAAAYITALLGGDSTVAGAGASGAIAGIMGAYLLMFPRARVTSLMFIPPLSWMHAATGTWGLVTRNISALWYVGSWILFQVVTLGIVMNTADEPGPYGVYAHVAGAICGMSLIWVARIGDRMPPDDHPCRSGELTAIIIGDEGDGGDGMLDLTPEQEYERWRHTPEGRLQHRIQQLRAPFEDRFAQQMLEQGDLAGAQSHCEQMLQLARQALDDARIAGYTELLDEIRERKLALPPAPGPRPDLGTAPNRVYEAAGGLELRERGSGRNPDPFNLGESQRGTRRR